MTKWVPQYTGGAIPWDLAPDLLPGASERIEPLSNALIVTTSEAAELAAVIGGETSTPAPSRDKKVDPLSKWNAKSIETIERLSNENATFWEICSQVDESERTVSRIRQELDRQGRIKIRHIHAKSDRR